MILKGVKVIFRNGFTISTVRDISERLSPRAKYSRSCLPSFASFTATKYEVGQCKETTREPAKERINCLPQFRAPLLNGVLFQQSVCC